MSDSRPATASGYPTIGLVAAAMQGDVEAFERLVAHYMAWLDAVARLIVRDESRAEDALQEALIKAWSELPRLRDPSKFESWLRRLLVRTCIDEGRRSRRWRQTADRAVSDAGGGTDSFDVISQREEIDLAFRELPPDQRAVLVLRYYVGLSSRETAEAMSASVGTVRSRERYGLRSLRAALAAQSRPVR